ncbi:MAG: hypothetical protein QOE06_3302 [Thermoleophilaceae bacterium]|jgi:hypothetical protein|nr:hypothetical protein [Thermoleophilaceae bacterium]
MSSGRRLASSGGALAVAVGAAACFVLAVQATHLGELMDPAQPLTAGTVKSLVTDFAIGVALIAAASALIPERLLWLPVAATAAVAAFPVLATLTVGTEGWSFAMALLTMGACWRIGRWALGALHVPALAGTPPAAWLAGGGLLALAILALGWLSAIRWWTVAVPVIVVGLSAALPAWRSASGWARERPAPTRLGAASASVIVLLLGVASVYAAAPELTFDALAVKALQPALWASSGAIHASKLHPTMSITGFAQVIAVPGHLVDAGGVGRYLQWLSVAATAASVWWVARRSALAPLAAIALVSSPAVFWQATNAYDDAVLMLAALGLAAGALALMRRPPASPLAAGAALGLLGAGCIGFKLHLAALVVGVAVGYVLLRREPGRLQVAAGFAAVTGALTAPPLVDRWIELGNPLFPAYNNVFKSDFWPLVNEKFDFPYPTGGGPLHFALFSVTDPSAVNPGYPFGEFGLVPAIVVVGAALLWVGARRDRSLAILWGAVALALIVWYQQFRYLRYTLPIAAVAAPALALCARDVRLRPLAQRGAAVAVCLAAALQWPSTVAQFWYVPFHRLPIRVALHRQSDYDYERTAAFERVALSTFNRLSPPHAIALSAPHQRVWLEGGRDLLYPFEFRGRSAAAAPPPAGAPLLSQLRELGVNWVVLRVDEPLDVAAQINPRHGELAWADDKWAIYRLVNTPRAPHPVTGYDILNAPNNQVEIPVCAGRTLVADVATGGSGGAAILTIDYGSADPELGHVRAEIPAGQSQRVAATAPPRALHGAVVRLSRGPNVSIGHVRFGTLGQCG